MDIILGISRCKSIFRSSLLVLASSAQPDQHKSLHSEESHPSSAKENIKSDRLFVNLVRHLALRTDPFQALPVETLAPMPIKEVKNQDVWKQNPNELSPTEDHFSSPWSDKSPQNQDQNMPTNPIIDGSPEDVFTD
ncbi:hypothetical protein PGT21_000926 [Puccinia graminis f. sp. tritici]|uniref:Uncharacterized protein n=1 Tax=Puccinia graminis f. sp. tritici TaxID=56615 RepID=A0A5B0MH53_PUCGR|nr:hypothetical protein PGT21_034092 [Puccinia graminis f. sp. tritici]KAA1098904.1 hypothetical protein PGT21_000202 [Puccinia graminis f. sp. tritici]KAA1102498.1 hypothetical protein PGT21_000926 [Puccinia graminis f. sp. tritici]